MKTLLYNYSFEHLNLVCNSSVTMLLESSSSQKRLIGSTTTGKPNELKKHLNRLKKFFVCVIYI